MIFSAHSLPTRTLPDGSMRCKTCDCADSCRYRDGLLDTADARRAAPRPAASHDRVAERRPDRTTRGGGRRSRTSIPQLAAAGHPAVVVCSAGFVADHLEILYDLDIEARAIAEEAGRALRAHADAERRPRVSSTCWPRSCATTCGRTGERRAGGRRDRARVVVVGGGVTGLTAAYRLTLAAGAPAVTRARGRSARRRQARVGPGRRPRRSRPAPTRSSPASRGRSTCARSSGWAATSCRRARPARGCGRRAGSCG